MAVDKEANSLSRVYSYYSQFNLCLFYVKPALARYLSILFLNILTLLACTQSVDNLFHTLMVLWENEYFLTSNLLCIVLYCVVLYCIDMLASNGTIDISRLLLLLSILLRLPRVSVCLCVCVCKILPISAHTLSFRHQTSRNFFPHSNFPIPYLWTAFCVPLSFVFFTKNNNLE